MAGQGFGGLVFIVGGKGLPFPELIDASTVDDAFPIDGVWVNAKARAEDASKPAADIPGKEQLRRQSQRDACQRFRP
jgi:hypothetical protein